MSEPSQKCEINAICKQNYVQKLFISFKISCSCCFGFRGNLEFPDFHQKCLITSTAGLKYVLKRSRLLLIGLGLWDNRVLLHLPNVEARTVKRHYQSILSIKLLSFF